MSHRQNDAWDEQILEAEEEVRDCLEQLEYAEQDLIEAKKWLSLREVHYAKAIIALDKLKNYD